LASLWRRPIPRFSRNISPKPQLCDRGTMVKNPWQTRQSGQGFVLSEQCMKGEH